MIWNRYLKRCFDMTFSLLGLVVCFPLFMIVGVIIKLDSKGPVFFAQERIGKDFKPFRIYKFRTMTHRNNTKGPLITSGHDRRITSVGKFLRKTKIDELPQLINVFKGDMSIVGPRPEVRRYVELFRDEYKEILRVKPGITDYATLEFRDEESILSRYQNPEEGYIKEILPEKIRLYRKYLKNQNFTTDMILILKTLIRVIKPQ